MPVAPPAPPLCARISGSYCAANAVSVSPLSTPLNRIPCLRCPCDHGGSCCLFPCVCPWRESDDRLDARRFADAESVLLAAGAAVDVSGPDGEA